MPRLHLIEIEDQAWCPRLLRDGATDYLAAVMRVARVYDGVAPMLAEAVAKSGATTIVDLCSGGGGPWATLAPALETLGARVDLVLTDLSPNVDALGAVAAGLPRGRAERGSVDARRVPGHLHGFRTLFTSFHHFRPDEATDILRDAARGAGIGVFEVTQRSPKALVGIVPSPLFVWLLTPIIRPFRWSRLLFTYLIPLIPLLVLFDGVVSVLRSYTAEEMRAMAERAAPELEWRAGTLALKTTEITYLIGVVRGADGTDS